MFYLGSTRLSRPPDSWPRLDSGRKIGAIGCMQLHLLYPSSRNFRTLIRQFLVTLSTNVCSYFRSFIRRFVVTSDPLSVDLFSLQIFYPSMSSYFRQFIRQNQFFYPLLYTLKFFVDLLIYYFRYLSSSDTSTVDSQLQILPSICDSRFFIRRFETSDPLSFK